MRPNLPALKDATHKIFYFTKDLKINGITVGRGGGNIFTNTAIGVSALLNVTTGNNNTAIGHSAGGTVTSGSFNTYIGYNARGSSGANIYELAIGNGALGLGSNTTVIGTNGATSAATIYGALSLPSTSDSSNTITGALIVSGGAGIAKKLYVGTDLTVSATATISSTTDATSSTAGGALTVSGGAAIAKTLYVGTSVTSPQFISTIATGTAPFTVTSTTAVTNLTASNVVTNANLTGVITSIGNATSIASKTGTGTTFVVDTSPTIITPAISSSYANTDPTTLDDAQFITFSNTVNIPNLSFAVGDNRVLTIGMSPGKKLMIRASSAATMEVRANIVNIPSTTAASSSITGALTVGGGAGIAGNLYVGGNTVITGNLTINGTTTTISSTTITSSDKNIELGTTGTPTDVTADGGGLTLKASTDKTFNWVSASNTWTSNVGLTAATKLVSSTTSFDLINTTATTVNFAGASTTLNISSGSATVTINGTIKLPTVGTSGFVKLGAGGQLSADTNTYALNNQTMNIGTTSVAINRASGALVLTGITSIDGSSAAVASQGAVTNNTTGTGITSGLTHAQVYNNGYPTPYGNVMTMYGIGASQLLLGWSGTTGATADNYVRSLRDSAVGTNGWSSWDKILTSANYNNYSPTLTGTGASGTWNITAASVTTNANLTGVITSIGNATSFGSSTGTGSTIVLSAGPTITGKTTVDNVQGLTLGSIGQFDAVYGSGSTWYNAGFRNDGSSVYLLSSDVQASQAAAKGASWSSYRPLAWNLSTGILYLCSSGQVINVSGGSGSSQINIASSNNYGGTGYAGFFTLINATAGATNPNKYIRTSNTGSFEIINSAYNAVILGLSDAGNLSLAGTVTTSTVTATSLTSGAAATAGTITGQWSFAASSLLNLNSNSVTLRAYNLTTNGTDTGAGSIQGAWTLSGASKLQATYADLAEYYEADAEYDVGTVLVFGGEKEVTQSTKYTDRRVAGVVSEKAAYIMNTECPGIKACIALQGRVPVKVIGPVEKGDLLVTACQHGYAVVNNDPKVGTVIGKSLVTDSNYEPRLIEVAIGRD